MIFGYFWDSIIVAISIAFAGKFSDSFMLFVYYLLTLLMLIGLSIAVLASVLYLTSMGGRWTVIYFAIVLGTFFSILSRDNSVKVSDMYG